MWCLQLPWLGNKRTSLTLWLFLCQDSTVFTAGTGGLPLKFSLSCHMLVLQLCPSVACVISSPSDVICQGFLIVHSWLDHKVSFASFFSSTLFTFCIVDHAFHSNFFIISSCIFPSQFLFLLLHCLSKSSQNQTKPPPIPRGEGRDKISLRMW